MFRRVRPSGNRESFAKWKARKHCSLKCRTGIDAKSYPPRPVRECAGCGKPTKNPLYCSKRCMGAVWTIVPETAKQGRNQAQRMYDLTVCQRCDAREDLHRHHRDGNPLNNAPSNIEILCHSCHVAHHRAVRRGEVCVYGETA